MGEEVEYITGNSMPKGTKVIVTDIWQDPCGCWALMHNKSNEPKILITAIELGAHKIRCNECDKIVGTSAYFGWMASSFRHLQRTKPMTFVKLAEIIETEKEEVLTLN